METGEPVMAVIIGQKDIGPDQEPVSGLAEVGNQEEADTIGGVGTGSNLWQNKIKPVYESPVFL